MKTKHSNNSNYAQAILRHAGEKSLGADAESSSGVDLRRAGFKRLAGKVSVSTLITVGLIGAANATANSVDAFIADRAHSISDITSGESGGEHNADIPLTSGEQSTPTSVVVNDVSKAAERIPVHINPK